MQSYPGLTLLGFWPFTYSAMLWWAAAAVIPILIHLLSRRRYRETNWAAMQFLLAAVKKHARRLRIEQLILLLLRVAVLVMLALALADPNFYQRSASPGKARGGRTHWVIVLDGSYSMDYRQGDKTLFAAAQEAARQLVSSAEQGDGFTLVLMGEPPVVAIRQPVFDEADVIREIDALKIRHDGADLTMSLREIQEIVDQATKRQPRLSQTNVCIYSDLGRTTWEAVEAEGCRRLIADLAKRARLHVVELGDHRWQNVAVTRLDAARGTAIMNQQVQFTAEVRRISATAPQQARAEWCINDQVVREEPLDLTSGGDVLAFSHRFATPGEYVVELRLADVDPLGVDDHRWRVMLVRENIRALCIEGAPGAARYVAAALEPRATDSPRIRWEIATERALVERDLASYDCVFVCNVGRFSSDEAAALRNYVHGGGGLAIFLGDQVEPADYNEKLGDGAGDEQRILPAALGAPVRAELRGFDPLEYQHALVRPFADHERAGLLTVPTWQYIALEILERSSASVALQFPNGDPALVEETIGRGRVILFASAATASSTMEPNETPWTELAVWPSFLPIVQQMVIALVERTAETRHLTVGEPLMGTVPNATFEQALNVTTPSGEVERVEIDDQTTDSSTRQWRWAGVYHSGIYHLQQGSDEHPAQRFAVNVDTRESLLDRADVGQLPSQLSRGLSTTTGSVPAQAAPYAPASYARWALAALLGLLLLETYLAWHFGSARV